MNAEHVDEEESFSMWECGHCSAEFRGLWRLDALPTECPICLESFLYQLTSNNPGQVIQL